MSLAREPQAREHLGAAMSLPSARPHPDETAPSSREVEGVVCPQCDQRFARSVATPSHCPKDGALLLRASDVTAAKFDPMLGRTLSERFTIVAKIGAGSMGAVY